MTSSIIKEKRKEYIFKSFQSKGEFFFEKDKKKSFNFFFETPPIFEEKLLFFRNSLAQAHVVKRCHTAGVLGFRGFVLDQCHQCSCRATSHGRHAVQAQNIFPFTQSRTSRGHPSCIQIDERRISAASLPTLSCPSKFCQ